MNFGKVMWLLGALLCLALVYSILWWGVGEIVELWDFPPFFAKVAYTILIVTGIVALIDIIIRLFSGKGFITFGVLMACMLGAIGCQVDQGTGRDRDDPRDVNVNVDVDRDGRRRDYPYRPAPLIDVHVDGHHDRDHHKPNRDGHHDGHDRDRHDKPDRDHHKSDGKHHDRPKGAT